ncbi:MAG: hypothetical protein ACXVPU_04830 [Bacteroidia bacterium]
MRAIIISIFLLFISGSVFSCECKTLQPISKELCKNYNVIFYGKVDSVGVCRPDGIATAYFTIIELYKGPVAQHVKVDFDCSSACMMSFSKDDEWLMYTTFQKFNLITANICDHNRKLFKDETEDIYQLAAHRTFGEERSFLKSNLGVQEFVKYNDLNKIHEEMGPRNEQPTGWNKILLLLISFSVMGAVYYFTRKKK